MKLPDHTTNYNSNSIESVTINENIFEKNIYKEQLLSNIIKNNVNDNYQIINYEFDECKNWTKRTYISNQPNNNFNELREITYYTKCN